MDLKENEQQNKKKNTKKIIGIILIGVALIIIGVFTTYKMYRAKLENNQKEIENQISKIEEVLINYDEVVEYGTTWKYDDFINRVIDKNKINKDTEIMISLDDRKLNSNDEYTFDELKEYVFTVELSYQYKYDFLGKEETEDIKTDKTYSIRVVDTVPPMINGLSDKTITEGDSLDLKSGITAVDNVDGEVEITTESEIDTTKEGTYKVEVTATDKSGNKATSEYTVTVNKKIVPPTTTKPTTTTTKPKTTKATTKPTTKKPTTAAPNDETTKAGRLNLAKQEAKRIASQIIKPGMTDEQKAYAIFVYLHSNVALQTNQSTEAYKTNFGNEAYAALVMKIAACSGFCKAVTLLCDEAGLQSQHINANLWTHQWNKVLIGGEWIILDAQGGIFGGTTHPLE